MTKYNFPSKRGIIDMEQYHLDDFLVRKTKKFNALEFTVGCLVVLFLLVVGAWILP